ncbi:MAG: polysaccharide biosynthesis protein [Pelagibacteraceae bacterium TMED124]|nr:MAG: polysaccharide biosynthesis protein [Pelagibacteraceae bacterium TMED124]
MRDILLNIYFNKNRRKNRVIIYGAGSAGAQLEAALRYSQKYKVCLFFDDNKNLHNRFLNGKRITSSIEISKYKNQIDTVLLAIPSLSIKRRFEILKFLQKYGVGILQIPSLEDVASGAENIDSLKPIDIEELLGRNVTEIGNFKEDYNLNQEVVCVTGAGGSIGGELSRQIFLKNPAKLVLIENSEVNLYQIIKELENLSNMEIELIPILGSACDKELVEEIFAKHKISVVFHAAAYKHVPLVEINPIQGLENNIFSTNILCEASLKNNCKKFILISTDKAVRPTNIMGVSKRLSEIIVQCFAELSFSKEYKNKTCFSMVRFGNVLGSSGSVVPLFKEQLNKGGPITLTHPDVIRYFMTIKESVHLVLQASVLAEGGEVFLLDMGEPVRIFDLAFQMIKLSGLTLKDSKNENGDIEIKITGLRPGEKLYEELLVDGNSLKTSNPQIFKAREKYIPLNTFLPNIEILSKLIQERNTKKIYVFLKKLMPEFNLRN